MTNDSKQTMSWFIGGHQIVRTGWLSPTSVYVDFVTGHDTGWLWQLYANRTLIGRTTSPGARRCVGQWQEATIPAPLTLVRVDPGSLLTDFGALLPRQPWNRFELQWQAATDPDIDTTKFEVTGSLAAGEAVDPDNLLVASRFIGVGTYRVLLPPLGSSGVWTYAITPRDDAKPLGNAGTAVEVEVDAIVMPPDVTMDEYGQRFQVSAVGGEVTVGFEW